MTADHQHPTQAYADARDRTTDQPTPPDPYHSDIGGATASLSAVDRGIPDAAVLRFTHTASAPSKSSPASPHWRSSLSSEKPRSWSPRWLDALVSDSSTVRISVEASRLVIVQSPDGAFVSGGR